MVVIIKRRNGGPNSEKKNDPEKVRLTRTDTLKKHRWRKSTVDGQADIEQSESSTVGKNHGKMIRQLIINLNQKMIFVHSG